MLIKRSSRKLLFIPISISIGIHILVIAGWMLLSWERVVFLPETPPIKISKIVLEHKVNSSVQKRNSDSAVNSQETPISEKKHAPVSITPQSRQPVMPRTHSVLEKLPSPVEPRELRHSLNQPTPLATTHKLLRVASAHTGHSVRRPVPGLGKTIAMTVKNVSSDSGQAPSPTPLVTHTLLRVASSHIGHSARRLIPEGSDKTFSVQGKSISSSSEQAFFSPYHAVKARGVAEEKPGSPLKASSKVHTLERSIRTAKANAVQVTPVPSSFVDELSSASVSPQSGQSADMTSENLGALRKGFSSSVWAKIAEAKYYPGIAQKRGWQGNPVIEFQVGKNGDLLSYSVAIASPYKILDQAALEAVKNARPYPKIPERLQLNSIRFKLPISFTIEE